MEENKPADHPAPVPEVESERKNENKEPQETTHEAPDPVDAETNQRDQSSEEKGNPARTNHEPQVDPSETDHPDDGGEVVEEDNEDTVIY